VYLKSLTLRGFKSFASATTLRFEPGITCAVGPNGSGKSNIVDALCWVMGEQGAKSLRGGKMEDVVFAGTASRPPLGRAEVTLTIDNSDGALPIDYAEVTISRLLFRSGQSEYAINGDHCRLLDVQELLSDSGMGREMHVVVGQGQLDEVLHAGPEARRALIEEAAGVLKHRKRKEKALRKLEAMQANLTRLVDLTAELRRTLKPLGRQAELARRAAVIQAELRDARLRLLADDFVMLHSSLEHEEASEALVAERRAVTEAALAQAQRREALLEAAAAQDAPMLGRAQDTWFGLSALAERLRGVAELAAERHHHLTAVDEATRPGRDPDALAAEAEQFRAQEEQLAQRLKADRTGLASATAQRVAADAALAAAERQAAAAARQSVQRAEQLAKLRQQVQAVGSRADATGEEIGRLAAAAAQAQAVADQAGAEHGELAQAVTEASGDRSEVEAAHTRAIEAAARAKEQVAALRADEHQASRERAALHARAEALQLSLRSGTDAAGAVLADPERFPGVLGPVATLLTVTDGAQAAVAAALGAAADAIGVASLDAAVAVIAGLKDQEAGRTGFVIASPDEASPGATDALAGPARLPAGVKHLIAFVQAPEALARPVAALLDGVVVADDLHIARQVVVAMPGLRVVTMDGDLLGTHWAHGGSVKAPSLLEVQAAADATVARLAQADQRCTAAARRLAAAIEAEEHALRKVAEAAGLVREADAAAADVSGRLGRLGGASRAAADEARRLAEAIAAAERARATDLARQAELQERLAQAEAQAQLATEADAKAGGNERDTLAERREAARNAEMEARLAVRTAEERAAAIAGRADALVAAAAAERIARERARYRREQRARQAVIAAAVANGAGQAVTRIEVYLAAALAERQAAQAAGSARTAELRAVREQLRQLGAEHDKLVNAAHTAEIARAEQRLRLEQIESRAVTDFGVHADALVAEYGPDVPVPPPPDALEGAPGSHYDRAAQERRAASAERQLARLGKVNPLALEEFAALEERHGFLSSQVEDLKKTRRDLLTVIKEVDDRVQQVFAAAYEDTAREFEQIFARLFPGGHGQLVLTEPDDMLTSGVEVEARPPGKKVKRLSLLSGGERSLTAIAYLVAIFKARPSPFYVLDEVEAALDDTNLQRLLGIFEELRESSQLIVITHQRRTMEVADALYGVTMRGDGVSAVVSQRLRERASA
jgi:chromosome segregation protein